MVLTANLTTGVLDRLSKHDESMENGSQISLPLHCDQFRSDGTHAAADLMEQSNHPPMHSHRVRTGQGQSRMYSTGSASADGVVVPIPLATATWYLYVQMPPEAIYDSRWGFLPIPSVPAITS